MNAPPLPAQQLWGLAAGFGVWCSALAALYALHGIGCAFAWSGGALRLHQQQACDDQRGGDAPQ